MMLKLMLSIQCKEHVRRLHRRSAGEPRCTEQGLDRADRRGKQEARTLGPCNENPTWVSPTTQPP